MKLNVCIIISFLASIALVPVQPAFAVNVWVSPDLYRIDPATGNPIEKEAAEQARFKKINEVWDSESKTVHLFGAKNEVLAFQVVLEGQGKDLDVTASDLKGPDMLTASERVRQFLVWNAFADGLIPYSAKGIHPFSIPNSDIRLATPTTQKAQSVWVDVSLKNNPKPGTYQGTINVTEGGKNAHTLTLKVTIWDITLPLAPTVYGVLNCYGPKYLRPFHDGYSAWKGTPDQARVSKSLWSMVSENRGVLYVMPFKSQRGTPRAGCTPRIVMKGGSVESIDWTAWDKRFGPYLDGSAFKDGVPVPIFYLPISPLWPVRFKLFKSNPQEYKKGYEAVLREYVKHFEEKKWTRTRFNAFGSMKKNVPWHLDEPTRLNDYRGIGIFADITAKVAKEAGDVQLRYQVDCGHYYCDEHKGGSSKDIEKAGGEQYLKNVNSWFVSRHSWGDKRCSKVVQKRKKEGVAYWVYGSVAKANGKTYEHVNQYLNSWRYGGRGYMYWSCSTVAPLDQKVPLDSRVRNSLVYNGNPVGLDRMLPAVRLKHMRRASFDCEYLELAANAPGKSRGQIANEVPKYMSNDPVNFYMGRIAMAEIILGKATAAKKLPLKPSVIEQSDDMFCQHCGELVFGGKKEHKTCPHCNKGL